MELSPSLWALLPVVNYAHGNYFFLYVLIEEHILIEGQRVFNDQENKWGSWREDD